MSKLIDLVGKKFGLLHVVKQVGSRGKTRKIPYWLCKCLGCGKYKEIAGRSLRDGRSKSCGCSWGENHGLRHHPLYVVWANMKSRCYSFTNERYKDYGGRGIIVCDQWLNTPSIFISWATNNGYKTGLQIDRFNNDLSYTPENCRFVTNGENALNTRLIYKSNTSGFRGVSFNKINNKFYSRIAAKDTNYYLGAFKTSEEAAKARDLKAIELNLHTPLNFPELAQ